MAQDYVATLEEWRPLAEEGNAEAQFGISLCYENGRGVERDLTQAAIWCRKAAEQNLDEAQFNLGNLYLNASGVPKDPVEAVRWFRRAAEQDTCRTRKSISAIPTKLAPAWRKTRKRR